MVRNPKELILSNFSVINLDSAASDDSNHGKLLISPLMYCTHNMQAVDY